MKRRIAATALVLALAVSLSGCSSMFNKEYLAISDYENEPPYYDSDEATEVRNYYGLKSAITFMVNNHDDYGELLFMSYDGDASSDLAQACWEVKNSTAYGAYSVDYMSYEIEHIVSYYKANIYVTYKRTAEEIEQIVKISNTGSISDTIEGSLDVMDESLLIWVLTNIADSDIIKEYAEKVYYSNPMGAVIKPEITVTSYPETGVHRIFEIKFDYGFGIRELQLMKEKLTDAVSSVTAQVKEKTPEAMALSACVKLYNSCAYDPEGKQREAALSGDLALGSTAYGALTEYYADSEGFAMAYKALCDTLGIECIVVRGSLDKSYHAWNIIKLGEAYYHVDVSQCAAMGVSSAFLNPDSAMWGRYWWDIEVYPACEGTLDYYDVPTASDSGV
jgi:hypothetical protein